MDDNNIIVFELIRQSLFPSGDSQSSDVFDDVNWEQIYTELKAHSVAALPCEYVIGKSLANEEIRKEWMHLAMSQVGQWTKLMEGQKELVNLLQKNNIRMAVIKGSAAAVYYPYPEYRTMGDVDFFVKKR